MKETYDFLKSCKVFYLSTIDGDKPRVRPFGAINVFENRLYFQTGKIKNVFKQIEINPNVEICGMVEGSWIRIEGTLVLDDRKEAKVSMLDNNPELKNMYSAEDDNTAVLYIKDATSTIYSFTNAPLIYKF